MANASKKFTHMVCSSYGCDDHSNEQASLFTSLAAATAYVQHDLKADLDNGESDEETYYIAEIISTSKIERSIVTAKVAK